MIINVWKHNEKITQQNTTENPHSLY